MLLAIMRAAYPTKISIDILLPAPKTFNIWPKISVAYFTK